MKYTKGENDLRKKIFAYKSNYKYCSKTEIYRNFGSSKAVKKATEDAFRRASYKEAKELTILGLVVTNNSSRYGEMAKCLPDTGYSMGEIKEVYIGMISLGEADNTREYAHSCKFRAKHGYISACLPARYLHARAEGGLITLRHKESSVKNIYHAEWLQLYSDKKYSSVAEYTIENGFVFEYKRLYFDRVAILTYHAHSLQQAKEMRKKLNADFLSDYKYYKTKKEKEEKTAKQQVSLAKKLIKRVLFEAYAIEDSIKAGNCVAGTLAFIKRHDLGKDVIMNGFDLLELAKKDSAKSYAYNLFQNRAKKYNECLEESIFNKMLDACVTNKKNYTIKFI